MVSFWPWKGKDNSPASFEKALSNLSGKITQAASRLDTHRQHARRFKALWTLYTTFAYLLYSIILALVLGWQNWGLMEYAALAGGPVLIYAVRAAASKYFDYRIAKTERHLETLQKERDETIEKLKTATKYNSTQQLLEKYGGETPSPGRSKDEKRKPRKQSAQQQQQQEPVARTGLPPPPTANIHRPSSQSPVPHPNLSPSPYPPQSPTPYPPQTPTQPQPQQPLPQTPQSLERPGFAPNAFPSAPQYIEQSHWYDRLFDVLLGEDEAQPKNRIALICKACRLVNGQAPPGTRTLEAVGRWRCGGCGAWNGEESETTKVLANIRSRTAHGDSGLKDHEADNLSTVGDAADDGVAAAGSEEEQAGPGADETANAPEPEGTDSEPDKGRHEAGPKLIKQRARSPS